MTFGESIRELRRKAGMTQKELAAAVGVSKHTIMRYENGESMPSFKVLSKIEETFGIRYGYTSDYTTRVSAVLGKQTPSELKLPKDNAATAFMLMKQEKGDHKEWIDSLDYEQWKIWRDFFNFLKAKPLYTTTVGLEESLARVPKVPDNESNIEKGKKVSKLMLPVIGRSAAGLPIEMIEAIDDPAAMNDETQARAGDFVVIAVGDSMIEAGIHDGDKCIIRPYVPVENGQIALVAIGDGSTIKRFYRDEDGYRLVPCNPTHSVQHYGPDTPIRILGRFVGVTNQAIEKA